MMRNDMFRAKVTRVMGPDLFEADIDLGFDTRQTRRLKLSGVDSEHVKGLDHDDTKKAMEFLRSRIEGQVVTLRPNRRGEHFYVRVLYGSEESDVLEEMVQLDLLRRFERSVEDHTQ